jgi:hypothetical protein
VREKFAHKEKKMAKKTWLRGAALALIAAVVLVGCSKGGSSGGGAAKASNVKAAPASDFTYDLTADKSGIVIKKYTGKGGKVAIPATIEDMPVTEIGRDAFRGKGWHGKESSNDEIMEIVMPASVTKIREGAFSYCIKLTKVTLPAGLEEMERWAFRNCDELVDLIIPNSLSSIKFLYEGKEDSDNRAFLDCGKLPLATRSKIEALGYTGKF